MSETKQVVLQKSLQLIEKKGYSALTMRSLAKACELKLGSLQYHFKTRDDLLQAIAEHIVQEYAEQWSAQNDVFEQASLSDSVVFIIDNLGSEAYARLWPQLWAMGLVEPIMQDMLNMMYSPYMEFLTQKFTELGCDAPEEEALALMSMLEGMTVFIGAGRDWADKRLQVKQTLLRNLRRLYGDDV